MELQAKQYSIDVLLARKVPWAQLPDWYKAEPRKTEEDQWFMDAFRVLGTERQLGWTAGPIPESAIDNFADKRGLDRAMIGVLRTIVRALDNAYLTWLEDQRKRRQQT